MIFLLSKEKNLQYFLDKMEKIFLDVKNQDDFIKWFPKLFIGKLNKENTMLCTNELTQERLVDLLTPALQLQ